MLSDWIGLTSIGSIVNGRYDMFCPPQTAWELHQGLPGSRLYIIPGAGHSPKVSGRFVGSICIAHADLYRTPLFSRSCLRSAMSMRRWSSYVDCLSLSRTIVKSFSLLILLNVYYNNCCKSILWCELLTI
jgi:hypothetical protein